MDESDFNMQSELFKLIKSLRNNPNIVINKPWFHFKSFVYKPFVTNKASMGF